MNKLYTFPGGIHPSCRKESSSSVAISAVPLPPEIIIPLSQHIGAPGEPVVKKGDMVKRGTLIGKSDKFISAPVFSSVSGKVKSIENTPHPVIGRGLSVIIENDGEDTCEPALSDKKVENLSSEEILGLIKQAGIVGMGGAGFPTHVKLSPPKGKPIDTFIANGVECEPYLTCDHRLMLEKGKEILKGIQLVTRLLSPSRCIIAIEANKPDAVQKMRGLVIREKETEVVVLKVKYPQGGEKQLIKAILNREVPSGGLPLDVGVVVHNVGTLQAIYEAVYLGKPLYERVVTVTGEVKKPGNYLVRIGTTFRHLLQYCEAEEESIAKLISGGPMMGLAQASLDTPVTKGTTGLVVQGKEDLETAEEQLCMRCGRCIDACPVFLLPTQIVKVVKAERGERLEGLNIKDCIECGCCGYVCPSKIPLVQYIKLGKNKINP